MTTALTRIHGGAITSQDDFATKLEDWNRAGAHVLCPMVDFSTLPPGHALVATGVKLDPNPETGDVYAGTPWLSGGRIALSKVGLRKLADCAGMSITTDSESPYPNYWKVKATAKRTGLDGAQELRESTFEWDLRDGSARAAPMTPKQLTQARLHGLRHCETRAINAVIRELGVLQTYRPEALSKPFVVVRLMYQPDMTDPATRHLADAAHFGAVGQLYPPALEASAEPIGPPASVSDADLGDLPVEPEPGRAAQGVARKGSHVSAVLCRGDGKDGGFVMKTTETGDRRILFDDHETALAAKTAMESGAAVVLDLEQRDGDWFLVEMRPAEQTS